MKTKLLLLVGLALMATSSFAQELGTCKYDGRTVADGIILNVCGGSGEGVSNVTLVECIERAEKFFLEPEECTRSMKNPFTGKVKEDVYMVHHKNLKYSFVGNDTGIRISGKFKHKK